MTIACPDCGTLQELPPLARGDAALCPSCRHKLERTNGRSTVAALACSLATFLLLFPANLLPLMSVSMLGMRRATRIGAGVVALWNEHWFFLALAIAAFVVVLPFVRFALLSGVLLCLRLGRRPAWLGRAFRWTVQLYPWAMPDVFLLGCAVGYSRVEARLSVTLGSGAFCFAAAAFLAMISRAALDRRTVWRAIAPERSPPADGGATISCVFCDLVVAPSAAEQPCPRCGARLHTRKPDAAIRTIALLIASFVLYFPANIFPMSSDIQLGERVPYRIVDGVIDLFHAGLWPLGVLIFCTSIAIPLLKLAGLFWFLISVRRRSTRKLVLKTRLYRLIDEIGRWSNVDVFTIAVFVPLMQFDSLVMAQASIGATAFLLVVTLTMIASRIFDPRLMWDAAVAETP